MREECRLALAIKATFQNIDSFCTKAEKLLRENNLDYYVFSVQMLLRETLTNAVVHGCRMDPELTIKISFIIKEYEIRIEVEDPGDGFDWRNIEKRKYFSSADSGRGVFILKKYADEYVYNKTGNCVLIKKMIVHKEKDHE